MAWNAFWCVSDHLKSISFLHRPCKGKRNLDNCGMNLLRKFTAPRNDWSSLRYVGTGQFFIAWTFEGSGLIPSSVTTFPKNGTFLHLNFNLFGFSVSPTSQHFSNSTSRFLSCSSSSVPYTRRLSAIFMTPFKSLIMSLIVDSKTSDARLRPRQEHYIHTHHRGLAWQLVFYCLHVIAIWRIPY